jgi:hypothetical protein
LLRKKLPTCIFTQKLGRANSAWLPMALLMVPLLLIATLTASQRLKLPALFISSQVLVAPELYPQGSPSDYILKFDSSDYSYTNMEVVDKTVSIKQINSKGKVIDQFTVTK